MEGGKGHQSAPAMHPQPHCGCFHGTILGIPPEQEVSQQLLEASACAGVVLLRTAGMQAPRRRSNGDGNENNADELSSQQGGQQVREGE